jgi:septal ring factor EnvC (AmiA/AmiB activator)
MLATRDELAQVRDDLAKVRAEVATKADLANLATRDELANVRAEMLATRDDLAKVRAEMNQRFDELDAELTLHAKVHRKVEEDIMYLKSRPPRTAAKATRRPRTR